MFTKFCDDSRRDIFIIDEEIMRLSTAWHLLNDERNNVTICDHQDDVAPSRDVFKILRIDYSDPKRMKEIMRLNSLWENDSVFNDYYKRTGRVVAYSKVHIETLLDIDLARSQLGLSSRKRQRAQLLKDLIHSTQVASDLTVVHNEDDGVVDWIGAMKSMKEDCLRKEEKFRNDRVIRMKVNTTGKVQAIVTSTEFINIENIEIILAAELWIMQLLEASFIQQSSTSRASIVIGIFSFSIEINNEQWKRYSNLSVKSDIDIDTYSKCTNIWLILRKTNFFVTRMSWVLQSLHESSSFKTRQKKEQYLRREMSRILIWSLDQCWRLVTECDGEYPIFRRTAREFSQCIHDGKNKHCISWSIL